MNTVFGLKINTLQIETLQFYHKINFAIMARKNITINTKILNQFILIDIGKKAELQSKMDIPLK